MAFISKRIFIKINKEGMVELVHYEPFHERHGLGKTQEELEREGVLLEELIPSPEQKEGKYPTMYYTKERGVYYEYTDIPKTKEEILLDRVKALEQSNAELMNLIMMQGIAPK